ncbi:recQ-mediated genome instability protein 1 isoform X2 [Sphaeramia orbicularis]|uniref:recQ-mediated genome instability protein 1 isoform X2 n=1 Tax=Sphaeramia orbicularis TaxID=375764 RepID=UPI00117F6120|nr:recQ-mediated genome instability protein 1 isoform X2 [Sphaeramia orbicularis]
MAPGVQAVVRTAQTWLQCSWHIQVPFAWLEACVQWLQEEAGGADHLSQQQINQQALDQWLLTDLRDLDYPVLPEGLAQAQKTVLSGTFCVQVDSLLDVSQPAYGQLQKWKGTDCANDEVSAVTQTTQRPWEAKPTRMLLLQVTDGVQSLEAMEYQPIPALKTDLRPGVKLQLQGQMVCRLGVLLLGPSNIKVLGGEVEDLVERNNQGRVLCRTLGLPEEQQQQQQGEEAPPAAQQENQDLEEFELDDQELLASLEAQEEMERVQVHPVEDSGYGTLSEVSLQSSRSSSVRSVVSAASSRSGISQSSIGGSVHGHRHSNDPEDSDLINHFPPDHVIQEDIPDHNMADDDFPDEDFDDLPLDELDSVIFQENTNVSTQAQSGNRGTTQSYNVERPTQRQTAIFEKNDSGSSSTSRSLSTHSKPSHQSVRLPPDDDDFMDEDMDCFLEEVDTFTTPIETTGGPNQNRDTLNYRLQGLSQSEKGTKKTENVSHRFTSESTKNVVDLTKTSCSTLQRQNDSELNRLFAKNPQSDKTPTAMTLTSAPFTYLCLLDNSLSKPQPHTTEVLVKAFIVTLLGKLSSSNGLWQVCATISDGTGYLDVKLSDEVLTGLLGFSVAEKAAMKCDPARRGELEAGMMRCQEGLVDMCCIMTISIEPEGGKAVVTKAEPITEKVLLELEQRVKARRK